MLEDIRKYVYGEKIPLDKVKDEAERARQIARAFQSYMSVGREMSSQSFSFVDPAA